MRTIAIESTLADCAVLCCGNQCLVLVNSKFERNRYCCRKFTYYPFDEIGAFDARSFFFCFTSFSRMFDGKVKHNEPGNTAKR